GGVIKRAIPVDLLRRGDNASERHRGQLEVLVVVHPFAHRFHVHDGAPVRLGRAILVRDFSQPFAAAGCLGGSGAGDGGGDKRTQRAHGETIHVWLPLFPPRLRPGGSGGSVSHGGRCVTG